MKRTRLFMAAHCQVNFGVVFLRLAGSHSEAEERQALATAIIDPHSTVPMPLMIDVRESTANPDAFSVAQRAYCLGNLRPMLTARCAVIATKPLQIGLARMFAAYAEGHGMDVVVFEDESQARHWLLEACSPVARASQGADLQRIDGSSTHAAEREQSTR